MKDQATRYKPMTFAEGLVLAIVTGASIGIINLANPIHKAPFLNWLAHFAHWMAPAFKWLFAVPH